MPEDISSSSVGIREQIAKYSTELIRLRELLDLAFASGAKASKASEDGIVFPLLVSCRDILEEMLFAVNEGFGRAAVRSVRTMYECVVAARYLNLHPEKTSAFLSQFHVQWAKIIQSMPPEFRSPEMHGTISKHVPKYAQGKWVGMKDLNWSGKQTLEMAKEGGTLSDLHSMAFDYASAFIHPSAVFVLNAMSQQAGTEHVLEISMRPQDLEAEQALRIAHDLILNAVDLRLKYAPTDQLQRRFDGCKDDFARIWGYSPHL